MALKVTIHVYNGFFQFPGVELVGTADLIEQLDDLFRSIPREAFDFFFVDEVANLFDHLIFNRN